MKGNKKTNVIFTIDIRVSGQTMSIPVYEGQNHQQLIQRFCEQHVFKSDYKQAIKDKIIQSLMQTLKRAQISSILKSKVNNFLKKNNESAQSSKGKLGKSDSSRQNKPNSQSSTPFKQLVQHSNPSQSQVKSSNYNRHARAHQDPQQQKNLKEIQVKSSPKPQAIRRNKPQTDNKYYNPSQSRSSVSKNQDFDLIAAYEVIYKKSKQPHMKNMAKRFLIQCGYLKDESKKIIQPKKVIQQVEKVNKSPKIIQKGIQRKSQQKLSKSSPMKKYQKEDSKDIKNSDIQSFNNYEVIQISRKSKQKSPSRYSPPKRHRIRYDIDGNGAAIPEREKYITQGIHFSRYQNQLADSSYRPQRASVSYERLPYHGVDNDLLNKSFYNNLGGYNEPERAISLRRTRKYKYL